MSSLLAFLKSFCKEPPKRTFKSPFYISFYIITAVSLTVYAVSRFSTGFAEFWSKYPGHIIRLIAASVSSLIPFSLAELLLVLIPVIIFAIICHSVRCTRKYEYGVFSESLVPIVCILNVISVSFCMGFGPCYFRNSLAENLGINDSPVSGEALYDTAVWLSDEITPLLPDIVFGSAGESHMDCSFTEMQSKVNDAFKKYASHENYISHFRSRVKAISLSDYMTYTHISGVYTFFTGEANINTNYPDFVIPYTIAHEMAHQRGIAREDEANFVAFLVCIESDDPYIRYSGYLSILREVMSALNKSDKELYDKFRSAYYPDKLRNEMVSYSAFFEKYRESTAAKVVATTNNAYLTTQKIKSGVKSYGLVTDLTVAYYESKIKNK